MITFIFLYVHNIPTISDTATKIQKIKLILQEIKASL